ncbi:MAG: hypothetical protein HYY48_02815 [Gammaproteobacteria bacterium]|nr:hypothetical protein [Gammaproteobacteria bacterium]
MGKTNLHEFSAGFTSNNAVFGPVRNPHDPARIPGGSSGGTAAAVAAGIAPLGIAEDTAGSIRVPAACCGIADFRPTTGRYPNSGAVPLTPTFDQLGPLAREVNDIVLFDAVAAGRAKAVQERSLKGVRIGVPRAYCYEGVAKESAVIIEEALTALRHAGVVLVEEDIPDLGRLLGESYIAILFYETGRHLDDWLKSEGIDGGLDALLAEASAGAQAQFREVLTPGAPEAIPDETYQHVTRVARPALRAAVGRYFETHRLEAMIVPATLCPAPGIGEDEETMIDDRTVSLFDALGHNTTLAPSCALPALTLPAGMTAGGLPVAVELDAPTGRDETLLALGLAMQKLPNFQARPPA